MEKTPYRGDIMQKKYIYKRDIYMRKIYLQKKHIYKSDIHIKKLIYGEEIQKEKIYI